MASQPKSKTYVVHQNGGYKRPRIIGRYRVGARNPEEAVKLLRSHLGKHIKVRVSFEDRRRPTPHGIVVNDNGYMADRTELFK